MQNSIPNLTYQHQRLLQMNKYFLQFVYLQKYHNKNQVSQPWKLMRRLITSILNPHVCLKKMMSLRCNSVNDHGRGVAHRTEYRPYSTHTRPGSVQPHPAKLKILLSTTLSSCTMSKKPLSARPRSVQRTSW